VSRYGVRFYAADDEKSGLLRAASRSRTWKRKSAASG